MNLFVIYFAMLLTKIHCFLPSNLKYGVKRFSIKSQLKDSDPLFYCKHKTENTLDEDKWNVIVYGNPVPLSRPRKSMFGTIYNPSSGKQKIFLEACKSYLPPKPFDGPIEVKLFFYFKRPKSHYRTGKFSSCLKEGVDQWHSNKIDLDNLIKFVLDALNKYAFLDDSQVCMLSSAKLFTEEESKTEIFIKKIKDDPIVMANF